jgi:hypothetical protein
LPAMWKGGNGSVQSGLFCADAPLERSKPRIKTSQTMAALCNSVQIDRKELLDSSIMIRVFTG